MGYAPGWILRCPGCGRAVSAARTGAVFAGKWSPFGSHTLGVCRRCRRLRVLTFVRAPMPRPDEAESDCGETWSELTAYVAMGSLSAEFAQRLYSSESAESRKREVAAYVAEGMMSEDDAVSMLELGGGGHAVSGG